MTTDPLLKTDQSRQPVAIPPNRFEVPHLEELLPSDWDRAIAAVMHEVEIPSGLEGRIWTSLQQAAMTSAAQVTPASQAALLESAAIAPMPNLPQTDRVWPSGKHRRLIAACTVVMVFMVASIWWNLSPARWTTTAAALAAMATFPADQVTGDRHLTPPELQAAARYLPAGWTRDSRWLVTRLQPLQQPTVTRPPSSSEPITVQLSWSAAGLNPSPHVLLISLPRRAVAVRTMPTARSSGSAEIVYGGSAAWMSWQEQDRVFVLCSPEGADLLEQIRTALQRTSQLG